MSDKHFVFVFILAILERRLSKRRLTKAPIIRIGTGVIKKNKKQVLLVLYQVGTRSSPDIFQLFWLKVSGRTLYVFFFCYWASLELRYQSKTLTSPS